MASTNIPFQPRHATLDDLDAICNIYFKAFAGSYILTNCFPRKSKQVRDFVTAARREDLEDPKQISFVVPDEDGKVIAMATWELPRAEGGAAPRASDDDDDDGAAVPWPRDGNPELAAAFFGGIGRKRREIMGDRRYWHLHLLAVLPEHQGKGLSTPLMNWGLERAKADGLPVYLDSTPRAKDVYLKFGFKVVDTITVGDGALTEYMMLKE